MSKEKLQEHLIELLNTNYPLIEKYLKYDSIIFNEFEGLIAEANRCILVGNPVALITLTNHLLERLLKLSLINDETGLEPIKDDSGWKTYFEESHKKFSIISLGEAASKCCSRGLIAKKQKIFIQNEIREQMRNGFSHFSTDKILKESPETMTMYKFDINNPTQLTPVQVNLKTTPFLQSLQVYSFARAVALHYFDFVYNLILYIEKKLKEKHKFQNE